MEKKTNLEILQEVREQRLQELKIQGKDNVTIPLVEIIGEKENERFIRIVEEIDKEEGKEIEERFYAHNGKNFSLVAFRNEQTEEILPISTEQKYVDIREDIVQCLEERAREKKALAKELGILEEEIYNMSEIDLEKRIEEQEERQSDESKPEQLDEKQEESIKASGLNEINMNTQIDSKGTSLAKALNLDECGYSKLRIVHAHQLTENGKDREGIKFGLVGVKPDGTMEKIPTDKIRMYRGSNEQTVQIDNPQKVEMKNNLGYAFEVVGTNRKLVIDQKDPYGRADVYLSQATKENDGNVAQKLQDQYSGTERTSVETRDLYSGYHGEYQMQKSFDEAEKHKQAGCENLELDEVDGDKRTGDIHLDEYGTALKNEEQDTLEEIQQKIADSCKCSLDEAAKYLEEIREENQGRELTTEEVIDEAQDLAARDMGIEQRKR